VSRDSRGKSKSPPLHEEPTLIASGLNALRTLYHTPTAGGGVQQMESMPRDWQAGSQRSSGLMTIEQVGRKNMDLLSAEAASVGGTHSRLSHSTLHGSRNGSSRIWTTLPIVPLSTAHRESRYPNTPMSLAWYQGDEECAIFVGLLSQPNLLKISPPKHPEPDKGGRFNVLPIDSNRFLLADESSHQIYLVNHWFKTKRHLAGCGKRGMVNGPLDVCQMNCPCSLALDPHTHYIYVADKGNHVIRKIDLLSGLMSTVCGAGYRGNCDSHYSHKQALDSPFEVSFSEPHYLTISCSDNSVRQFNLLTNVLETMLVGS